MKPTFALLAAATLFVAGCEGLYTGSEVARMPLEQTADGAFAPVKLQLSPDMNPIALNMHGETVANAIEGGHWNTYAATLARNGSAVASARFNVNNTGSVESAHGGAFQQTMLVVSVPEAGEYELVIALAKPREITVNGALVAVRKNTQPPPK